MNCCHNRFESFTFDEIRNASPPCQKGVYVVRIKARGAPTEKIIGDSARLVNDLKWANVGKYVMGRINRLVRISECPIIYIGSAGTKSGSKNTLQGRYQEFYTRHTAMYPLWALIYYEWNLEFGWLVETHNPGSLEKSLKQVYRSDHSGAMPALVEK